MQRLPNLLSQIQFRATSSARMEICSVLLWCTFHPSLCILLRQKSGSRSDLWLCNCEIYPTARLDTERRLNYSTSQLWCWIAIPWDFLRIALFYGPVWFVISLTFAIYLRAGSVIYEKRRQLRNIGGTDSLDADLVPPLSPFATLAGIQVTREIACYTPEQRSLSSDSSFGLTSFKPYSVTIQGGTSGDIPLSLEHSSRPARCQLQRYGHPRAGRADVDSVSQRRSIATEASSAAWAYTKYAMLFFIALLVTWVCGIVIPGFSLYIFTLLYANYSSPGPIHYKQSILPRSSR